jgi:two-component sensor histidine kinase/CheY-like chemotaxis protein
MSTVMIAEDDLMMADMLEDVLDAGGYDVCGIARTVDEAVELGDRCKPDLAILDIQLAEGGIGTDIPPRLKRQDRMGVLYASGNVGQICLTKVDGDALLIKPYRPEDVLQALKIVEHIVSTGEASRPFPNGFSVLKGSPEKDKVRRSDDSKSNEIRRLRRQQKALADFGGFALGERDLGKVLTEAARVCAECFEVPFCKVCRFRSEENDLLVEAGVGWHQGVIGRVVSRADASSPQGRAFSTAEPVICGDLSKDVSFVLPSFYAEHNIISTVDVIIKKQGRPYGVLEIDSPVQQDYDQHDINFLTGFANVLAEAVNTSKRNNEMQNAIDRMRDMVTDKDRLLVLQTELLEEKAVLARELQHRVRNNLQLVYGMLDRQLRATTETSAIEGISAIARRVMTLAQVYEHLLGTGLSRTIEFSTYLSSLCSSLVDLEYTQHPNVDLNCHLEPVILDLESVTALGLVTSELVANSYAHAFPSGTGSINVSLSQNPSHEVATMVFTDDGVGFADTGGTKRHGLGLVRRLMEQLGGSATLRSDHGTEWTLDFPVSRTPPASRPAP